MKYLLIFSIILAIAMFYLGISQHITYAIFFGFVLLLTTFKFVLDIVNGKKEEGNEKK